MNRFSLKRTPHEKASRALSIQMELKTETHSIFSSPTCGLACEKSTFESRENMAMSTAIFWVRQTVCEVGSVAKVYITSRNVIGKERTDMAASSKSKVRSKKLRPLHRYY